MAQQGAAARKGSPPRMRGKVPSTGKHNNPLGITPAHAGKNLHFHPVCSRPRDHPRACGEKQAGSKPATTHQGSPPRMRGKTEQASPPPRGARITPAHAGKNSWCRAACAGSGDHPRACGEKQLLLSKRAGKQGSPPRMRGKNQALKYAVKGARITPAHAGKNSFRAFDIAPYRDHPRACGEKQALRSKRGSTQGSPPRMRGKN